MFEVLTEEIPAWMLRDRLSQLREELAKAAGEFTGRQPNVDELSVDATSRRIAFRITGLPDRQDDREEEVKGPPSKVAFDADGNPTKALEGFLRKNGASKDDVVDRDSYVWVRRTVNGLSATEFLGARVPKIVESIRWPKMMVWGEGRNWIRPVHSVISIFGGTPVPVTIFGIESGTSTLTHRTRGKKTITVSSWDDYVGQLADAGVVLSSEERVAAMRARCEELAAEVGGTPAQDDAIWEQWRYLTETPGIVRAEFDERFLALPDEVLVTVMRVHQKQLPIRKNGELTTSFLAVMDGADDPDGNTASGNAFVSNARFADALFFHETDRKRTLESRVDDLVHLQFQEKIGNYLEKTKRIEGIVEVLARNVGTDVDAARQAARLSKTDLMTEMVKEFTDLQGQVGGIYAREEGLPENVWQAIYDHYLPKNLEDSLPRTIEGALVALADRIDTLAAFFSIGLRPTGSKDPFALRRAAQGIVQILLAREAWSRPLSIDEVLAAGAGHFGGSELRAELYDFLEERTRTVLEARGWAYDEIDAAMATAWSESLTDLEDRIAALHEIRTSSDFLSVLDSAKRIANIVPDQFHGRLDPAKLEHPTERRLAELSTLVSEQIGELVRERKYTMALESFAGMAPELEKFFVDVMVMVDDEALKQNRWALLRSVGHAAERIAVVTRIVVDRKELAAR